MTPQRRRARPVEVSEGSRVTVQVRLLWTILAGLAGLGGVAIGTAWNAGRWAARMEQDVAEIGRMKAELAALRAAVEQLQTRESVAGKDPP